MSWGTLRNTAWYTVRERERKYMLFWDDLVQSDTMAPEGSG